MTIDSPQQFTDYFDIRADNTQPSSDNNTDWNKATVLYNKEKSYYNNDPKPNKITKTSNPVDDKKIFLNLMKDIGSNTSLFEVDNTFTNFSKVNLNNNGTLNPPTPCTN